MLWADCRIPPLIHFKGGFFIEYLIIFDSLRPINNKCIGTKHLLR